MRVEIDLKKVAGPALLVVGWILVLVAIAAVTATAGRWVLMIVALLAELAGLCFFGREHRGWASGDAGGQA